MEKVFLQYRKSQIAQMRPYQDGEDLTNITVSQTDKEYGSPKEGDMIARNPLNHADQWLVAKEFFEKNYAPL